MIRRNNFLLVGILLTCMLAALSGNHIRADGNCDADSAAACADFGGFDSAIGGRVAAPRQARRSTARFWWKTANSCATRRNWATRL